MYWIIEPHADDAFLSLHTHAVAWIAEGIPISIVTVYSNPLRNEESIAYARRIGAKHFSLHFQEQGKPILTLPDWLLNLPSDDRRIFPSGLGHTEHAEVYKLVRTGDWRYLDVPYQVRQELAEDLQRCIRGRRLVSICYPSESKWEFAEMFKTQAKFFRSNPIELLCQIPEIIIE